MIRNPWLLILLALASSANGADVSLRSIVSGLNRPVYITHSGDGSGRLFVLEQPGRVRLLESGKLSTFLDIRPRVTFGGEMGLLGLAFHPGYSANGRFFVNYTRDSGGSLQTVVAEYRVNPGDPRTALPEERVVMTFQQPFTNHNGGSLAFGPDGFLYIATGDGGSGGDPQGNGQNLNTLLGKILRIDVDRGSPYAIPPNNPFVGQAGRRPEIWAFGLRNPWRFSFDRATGQLYAGDVGQGGWEEVDLIEAGANYGWDRMEGPACFEAPSPCSSGLVLPIDAYGRSEGASVIGGYVYRGPAQNPLRGAYLFGDFVSGRLWSLRQSPGGGWERRQLLQTGRLISSFGEDETGNLFLVDWGSGENRGEILQLDLPSRLVIAHRADGISASGRFRSQLQLANAHTQDATVTMRFYTSTGAPQNVTVGGRNGSEHSLNLPAGATTSLSVSTNGPLTIGWVDVESSQLISASVLYTLLDGNGQPLEEAGIASSSAGALHIGHVERRREISLSTAVAVVNLSDSRSATLIFRFRTAGGSELTSAPVILGPGAQVARFIEELVTLPNQFEGTLTIESTEDTAATLIRTLGGIQSASLPVATR